MCIKNVYHNLYSDGERDITERVITCHPGHVCSDPIVREIDRKINCTRLQMSSPAARNDPLLSSSSKKRQLTPPYFEYQPTIPRPRDDRERRREKRASHPRVYVDGDKVIDYGLRRSGSHRDRAEPIPIPKPRRSSTLPINDASYNEPSKRESRSRPIVVESSDRGRKSSSRRESAAVPLGPFDVLNNYGSGSSRREREKHTAKDSYLEPQHSYRRHSKSPVEVHTDGDGDRDRERHHHRRAKPTVIADGLVPAGIPADAVYGSSPYAGSYGSSYGSHRSDNHWTPPPVVNTSQSPPNARTSSAGKGVRWEDDMSASGMRAVQNARINSRPKLSQSATISGAGMGSHEVKSILKNSTATTGAGAGTGTGTGTDTNAVAVGSGSLLTPAVQPLRREELDDLYKSEGGLGVDERETSAQRQLREGHELEDREYRKRLLNRFSTQRERRSSFDMLPRRFTVEKASRAGRRSDMFYPDEGRYKYI